MIYGIGTDICDVRRIRAAPVGAPWRAVRERVLTDAEFKPSGGAAALERARPALPGHPLFGQGGFSKAIGLGMRMPMTWRARLPTSPGKPIIVLHGELKAWFEAQGLRPTSSPTKPDYAASFVG